MCLRLLNTNKVASVAYIKKQMCAPIFRAQLADNELSSALALTCGAASFNISFFVTNFKSILLVARTKIAGRAPSSDLRRTSLGTVSEVAKC